jgi:hypothetical protein
MLVRVRMDYAKNFIAPGGTQETTPVPASSRCFDAILARHERKPAFWGGENLRF